MTTKPFLIKLADKHSVVAQTAGPHLLPSPGPKVGKITGVVL